MSKLAAAFALSLVACTGPSLASLAVGDTAPDFSLENLDGQKVSLSAYKGKTVVLEWMNPNCPFSLRHSDQKTMASTADKYPDAVWLAINSTNRSHKDFLEPAAYKKFNAEKGVDYAVLYDTSGEVGKAYGASTTPHMFVVDGAGKIAYVGAIDDAPRGGQAGVNYVDSALGALAAGKSPDPAATKPYGCSVKY